MKRRSAILACGLIPLTSMVSAQEPKYPSRPITIVLPFGPGSGTDTVSRLLAQRLNELLGQQVIIDNKPGANGSIAAVAVAKSKPDGYTLLMGTNSTHGANPGLQKGIRYDPIADFVAVNRVAVFTSILVVHPGLPVTSMRQLVRLGQTRELTLATGNASGAVMSETLARAVGWKLLRVPFKSNPEAVTEVISGRIDMMFVDYATALPHLQSGALRVLAVATKRRSALLPEAATLSESGAADYDLSGWIGLFAPAGTPKPIVERLNAEVTKVLGLADVRQRLAGLGAEPEPQLSAEFATWTEGEVKKWTRLAKEAGIQPE